MIVIIVAMKSTSVLLYSYVMLVILISGLILIPILENHAFAKHQSISTKNKCSIKNTHKHSSNNVVSHFKSCSKTKINID